MISNLWRRFAHWFSRPASPVPLAYFRIGVGLFCIFKMLDIQSSFLAVYGEHGIVQWSIAKTNMYSGLIYVGDVCRWLGHLGLSPNQSVYLLEAIYFASLGGLILGFGTRWMAAIALAINYLWMHVGGGLIYGMDLFTHIALFYCLVMPVGAAFSLDAKRKHWTGAPSTAAGVTRKMLQLHLCVVYLSSGLEKASGIQWWDGEAVWRSMMLPVFNHFNVQWMAWAPAIPMVAGWLTLLVEVGYAFFIWPSKTRRTWLILAIGMHLSIGLFMGLWLFAFIMILLNLGAFGFDLKGREGLANVGAAKPVGVG